MQKVRKEGPMWFFLVLGFPWKKSYMEKSVVSIMDQREYVSRGKSIQSGHFSVEHFKCSGYAFHVCQG